MTRKFYYILPWFILLSISINAQLIEHFTKKIDLKLKYDKDYLNIKAISFEPIDIKDSLLRVIPKKEFGDKYELNNASGITYQLTFLDEGIGIDSIYLLQLIEIETPTDNNENLFGDISFIQPDSNIVLSFADLYNLKINYSEYYKRLLFFLKKYLYVNPDAATSLLKINPNREDLTSLGVSARNKADYIAYGRAISSSWFPKPPKESVYRSSRAAGQQSTSYPEIELTPYSLTLSHSEWMKFGDQSSASIFASTNEELLNVLPWSSNLITVGARILISSEDEDFNNSFYFDSKLGYRIAYDNTSIIEYLPASFNETPKLNFHNSMFGKLTITRPFGLPFLTVYASSAKDDGKVFFSDSLGINSYHTFNQFQFYFSFYWNASDKLKNRFKLDVGLGYHDVVKRANFVNIDQLVYDKLSPILNFYYTFFQSENPFFGINLNYYNSRIKGNLWFSILRFGLHEIRVESFYLTEPIMRDIFEWESRSSLFYSFKWRMGL